MNQTSAQRFEMRATVVESIDAINRDEWNALFPGELENWNYYRAVEKSGLPGFEWLYFCVRDDYRLCAVVPAFVSDYALDTTMSGFWRRVTNAITRVFPRFLRVRMLGLGSPVAEVCHLGFASDLDPQSRCEALDAILAAVEVRARACKARLLAIKDASAAQDALWTTAAHAHGLRRQPGLPTATLKIDFDSVDEYLRSLSRATRRDLRRKLKTSAKLRVEWRTQIDDIRDDVMCLYRATLANAQYSFEELTEDYFSGVLRELGSEAVCATYWLDERLVAFNLVLRDDTRMIDKFLGMDNILARSYNIYFCSWIENVRYCIDHHLSEYQSGQGLHREKLRLGSTLRANWLWYRHRNRILDTILALFERLARLDRYDPDLAALVGGQQR
ncbi:MAG: GNAT family N-acetyltransferase [Rudaea sp.]